MRRMCAKNAGLPRHSQRARSPSRWFSSWRSARERPRPRRTRAPARTRRLPRLHQRKRCGSTSAPCPRPRRSPSTGHLSATIRSTRNERATARCTRWSSAPRVTTPAASSFASTTISISRSASPKRCVPRLQRQRGANRAPRRSPSRRWLVLARRPPGDRTTCIKIFRNANARAPRLRRLTRASRLGELLPGAQGLVRIEMAKLFLSAMLAFWLVLGCAGRARAADAEREARERYDNAVKLYEEGAYDAALVELNRAAELRPSYKLYYNIGQVRYAMHDYAAASDAYRRYLEQGGDKIPSSRREQVQKELNDLAQRVAKLTIDVDVPGAEILIDECRRERARSRRRWSSTRGSGS